MRRIAVDAMGSDGAPVAEVEGSYRAALEHRLEVVLVGDETRLAAELDRLGSRLPAVTIRHASQTVTMDDHAASVLKTKRDASMRVCFDLLHQGEVEAVVSAGHSGAMLALGVLVAKRIPGVDRPGIAALCPASTGKASIFIDVGANIEARPLNLVQYAVMGAVYAQATLGITRPRVALLANGTEASKGTALTRRAHELLTAPAVPCDFDFIGYVEGCDLFRGIADVIVTDGFTGNVALKTAEGVGRVFGEVLGNELRRSLRAKMGAWLALPALRSLKRRLAWDEYGGAPLLGVRGVVMICHGRSNATAIKNAIVAAHRFAGFKLAPQIAAAIERHSPLWQGATSAAS